MLNKIIRFSLNNRVLIIAASILLLLTGTYTATKMEVDVFPDLTAPTVVVLTEAHGMAPEEVERLVTFPVETALAGIPGLESTRSISRNGFSQVTAVFHDDVDIYFARQQVNERLTEAKETLPQGAEPVMGAISTGLGEIYMWTVAYTHPKGQGATIKDGEPGWQSDGSYLTPEGHKLKGDVELM